MVTGFEEPVMPEPTASTDGTSKKSKATAEGGGCFAQGLRYLPQERKGSDVDLSRDERMLGIGMFEGIGGISLALERYVRSIAYCENEPFAQAVLLQRMASGELSNAPIWNDVRTFPVEQFLGCGIDIIYGGFPCQDISTANGRIAASSITGALYPVASDWSESTGACFPFQAGAPGRGRRACRCGAPISAAALPVGVQPNARDHKDTGASQGSRKSPNLGTAVHRIPTPRARERGQYQRDRGVKGKERPTLQGFVQLFPTPRAVDGSRGIRGAAAQAVAENRRGEGKRPPGSDLPTVVGGGTLNPRWVEWLMGYRIGWLSLEDWATAWYRSQRKRRSKGSLASKT
jgi:DNA (cytosine-5)-methyltransferase 1